MFRTTAGFFGSTVLAATFVLAMFGWGVGFYGTPIYLQNVVQRTGWDVSLVSGAVTLHFVLGAVVVANFSKIYQRFGVPRVTFFGAVASAVGTFGWAVSTTPFQLYVAAALSGAGWVALGAAAVNRLISPWFVTRRPAALGMAYNGASVGGIVFAPLWVALIGAWGFTTSAALIGVIMTLVVGVLCITVFVRTPESMGQHPDGQIQAITATRASVTNNPLRLGSVWSDRRFLTLALGMSLGLFAQIGLVAHLFSIVVPLLGDRLAGAAMAFATACAIGGRIGVGRLMGPHADRRLVSCFSYGVQFSGSILLLFSDQGTAFLWLGIALFGLGIGNATSLPPLIAQVEFSKEDVQRVVPLLVGVSQGTYAFAPALFGVLRSVETAQGWGAGSLMFTAAALIQVGAMLAFWRGRTAVF